MNNLEFGFIGLSQEDGIVLSLERRFGKSVADKICLTKVVFIGPPLGEVRYAAAVATASAPIA